MIRRLLCALAALAVFAVGSLVWASPASAAPKPPCSLEEWGLGNFVECAGRLGDAVDAKAGCVTAPMPGSPAAGMPGWFSARPESSLRDGVTGPYSRYGTGGYKLDTFNQGCLAELKRPDINAWNMAASTEFTFAASVMGFANALRERAYEPGTMWGWADGFVADATDAIYRYVFTVAGGLGLAALGLYLVWQARQGNISTTVRLTAWALFVIVATTGLAKYPVKAAHTADAGAAKVLGAIHSVVGPGPQHIPENECVLGGQACIDSRTVAVRSSDIAVDAILYRPWLRAMLGTADSPTAQKYGPALYDATTMNWGEAARADQSPQLRQQVLDEKSQTFIAIAEQIRVEDPVAYEYLQGIHGSDRFGFGLVALLSATAFAAFDSIASIIILLGFLIFRIVVILFPLLATFGVFEPASGALRRVMNMSLSAFTNIIVWGTGAGIYLFAMTLIFGSDMPGFLQVVAVALTGAALIVLLRPHRHATPMLTGRAITAGSFARRITRGARGDSAPKAAPVSPAPAGETGGQPPRPETLSSRPRALPAAPADSPAPARAATATMARPETSTATPATRPSPQTEDRS